MVEWNIKNVKRIMLIIAFAILLFLGLQNLSMVLSFASSLLQLLAPFFVGFGIAFILNVPMRFLETKVFRERKKPAGKIWKKLRRPVCLVLTLIFVAAIIAVVLFLVLPELSKTVISFLDQVPVFLQRIQDWLRQALGQDSQLAAWMSQFAVNWEEIGGQAMAVLQGGVGGLFHITVNVVTGMIQGIVTFTLGFIFALYVLLQKETLAAQIKKLLRAYTSPRVERKILEIGELSDQTFSRFLSGQCLESVILGGLFFIGMTIFRFPYAIMISAFLAFTSLIPMFGAFIGCVVGAFFVLLAAPGKTIWFLVLFFVIQQLESNLIYPYVVGNSVGLSPIWVLVAVTTGGSLLGVWGMVVFIPLFSVLYTLLRRDVQRRLVGKPHPARAFPHQGMEKGKKG